MSKRISDLKNLLAMYRIMHNSCHTNCQRNTHFYLEGHQESQHVNGLNKLYRIY